MEALFLALGLGMPGAAMVDENALPHEPGFELGVSHGAQPSPGWAVIHEHSLGQAVGPKATDEFFFDSSCLVVIAGGKHQAESGMIVQHGQRMAPGTGGQG